MPIDFLTAAERERLKRFPEPIPDDDLRVFFMLSQADQLEVGKQRGAHHQLGFALQLCALRYLGFAPDDLGTPPWPAVMYVARQLGLPPEPIKAYGSRIKTRTTHLQQIQAYLGFRPALPLAFVALTSWLVDRALEHDKPTLLLQLACEKLRREQIVRPGITRLERLVATAREQAQAETFQRLTPWLTPARPTWLDGLLAPDPAHLAPAGSDVPRRLTDPRHVGDDHVSQGRGRGAVGVGGSHAQSPEMAGPGGMARHPSTVAADAAPATLSDPAGRAASGPPAPYRCRRGAL